MIAPPCKLYVNRLSDGRVRIVLAWENGQLVPVYLPLHLVEQLGEGLIKLAREIEADAIGKDGEGLETFFP